MDRKAILAQLAREGQLTEELALYVRAGAPDVVRKELERHGARASVRAVAGIFTVPPKSVEPPELSEIQSIVDVHMALLGLEPWPVRFEDSRLAERVDLMKEWEAHLVGVAYPYGARQGLPQRVARLVAKRDDPAWTALVALIQQNVWPMGPAVPFQSFEPAFLVVDARHPFPPPPTVEEIEEELRARGV